MTDMTDKKLTDEEIIKALEDYIKENEFEYFHSNMVGEYPLIRKSLDLINRQRAEIERLNEYIKRCKSGEEYWVKCLLDRQNEAYKEFAKLLIDKASKGLIHVSDLPDFVKEMVGEEE